MAVAFEKNLGTDGSGAGGNLALTVPAGGVPIGNVVCCASCVSNSATVTITDSRGNTYTLQLELAGTTSWVPRIHTAEITTALLAGDTITFTFNTGTHKVATADEFSGVDEIIDVAPGGATGTTTAVSNNITTVNADDLIYGHASYYVGATPAPTLALTDPTNWIETAEHESGSGRAQTTFHRIVASTGTYTADGTLSATPTRWQEGLIALTATAGGGGVPDNTTKPALPGMFTPELVERAWF